MLGIGTVIGAIGLGTYRIVDSMQRKADKARNSQPTRVPALESNTHKKVNKHLGNSVSNEQTPLTPSQVSQEGGKIVPTSNNQAGSRRKSMPAWFSLSPAKRVVDKNTSNSPGPGHSPR